MGRVLKTELTVGAKLLSVGRGPHAQRVKAG